MHIVGCQLDIRWHDKPANYQAVRELLRGAAAARQPDRAARNVRHGFQHGGQRDCRDRRRPHSRVPG